MEPTVAPANEPNEIKTNLASRRYTRADLERIAAIATPHEADPELISLEWEASAGSNCSVRAGSLRAALRQLPEGVRPDLVRLSIFVTDRWKRVAGEGSPRSLVGKLVSAHSRGVVLILHRGLGFLSVTDMMQPEAERIMRAITTATERLPQISDDEDDWIDWPERAPGYLRQVAQGLSEPVQLGRSLQSVAFGIAGGLLGAYLLSRFDLS